MFQTRMILPLLLAAVCTAQEDPTESRVRTVKKFSPVITMSFGGGTMSKFVSAIRGVEPKANIIVAASAASARVPGMEIKDAGLDQVLDSACAAAEAGELMIGCSEQRGNGEPVFAILGRPRSVQQVGPGMPDDKDSTLVLSLNRLTESNPQLDLDGMKVATILSAIEASSHFDTKAPKLRYHEDSGLLFLHGSRAQLALAADVLQILERDQKERLKYASPRRPKERAGDSGRER